MKLPFSHLNLLFNPFGELTKEDRSEVAFVDLEDFPVLLKEPRQAIQFIGGHGRGKSTHLIALHNLFKESPYTKIHAGDSPKSPKSDIQFVDSIEFLSASKRRKLFKKSDSIAFTTHIDLTEELHKLGFTVHSREISQVEPKSLHAIFTKRIEFARRSEGAIPTIALSTIAILQDMYKDDIRAMESHLYHIFQEMKEIENVQL